MCRVNSFLNCIRLETFSLFIGWLHMILMIVGAFISILAIFVSIIEQDGIAIAISLFVLILCFLMTCICKQLVEGVETRNSAKVKKYRILCFIGVVFGVFQVLFAISKIGEKSTEFDQIKTRTIAKVSIGAGILSSLIALGVLVYIFVCIDSLYKMLEEEKFPQTNSLANMRPDQYVVSYQPPRHNPYWHQSQGHVHSPPTVQKY